MTSDVISIGGQEMRLVLIGLCVAAIATTPSVFSQTNIPPKPLPAAEEPAFSSAADPVKEFERIVRRCRAAIEATNSPAVSVFAKGSEWIRRVSSFEVRYDVKKTDSLVAPVIGIMEIQILAAIGSASNEAGARELTFTAESSDQALRRRYKLSFVWRDDLWSFKDGTSIWDHRGSDGDYDGGLSSLVDLAKGRDYYGSIGQCFP